MRSLTRIFLLLTLLWAGSGREAPPPVTPVPDSTTWAFRAEEVAVDTGAVTLAGTLLMPFSAPPSPAVIIVPGSGAASRNGSWNMYRSIGEHLAQHGLAVLLYDKRGVGSSTGNWESETFDERAQDVGALVKYLISRREIDPDQIGLIGHSQGAYIVPLVVAKYSNDVKLVAMLAGPGQKVWDQVLTNERAESLGNGLAETTVNERAVNLENQLEFIRKVQSPCRVLNAHYLCFVLEYDPTLALETLTMPTLALYAELDTQVPPDVNIPLLESALQRAGNVDYTIHTFEKSNHWFALAETGTTSEMRELAQQQTTESYEFVPGFLEVLEGWIAARVFDENQ